jgi:hypothetical protein
MRKAGYEAYIGTAEVHTGFRWGDLSERGHVEDLDVDGKNNIKMDLQEVGWGGMNWIALAEDREVFVIAVMNHRIP